MPTDLKNPCQAVAKLIEAVNRGERISDCHLDTLRLHLSVFPRCQALLNEQGERIVCGDTTSQIGPKCTKKSQYH